jgi:YHS domain-containing protein
MVATRRMILIGLALVAAGPALAGEPPVFSDWRGRAIRGYDVVAYFTEGKPVPGSSEFTHEWKGAVWQFASATNRDLFAANPEAYAPQYGGYCAYAVANGSTASVDPEAWQIVDGKLYLNYSRSILKRWQKDVEGYITKADANWPRVLQ